MLAVAVALGLLVAANLCLELTRLENHRLDRLLTLGTLAGTIALAAVPCFYRAARGGRQARPWAQVGIGLLAWATGEVLYVAVVQPQPGPVSSPNVADALYLAYYAAVLVGLWRLARAHGALRLGGPSVLVAALGIATLWSWTVLSHVLFDTNGTGLSGIAIATSYPVFDLFFLLFVAGVFACRGARAGAAWACVAVALIASALADSWWAVQIAQGTYSVPHFIDSLWPLSGALLGVAALLPPSGGSPGPSTAGVRMPIPLTALAIALAALIADHFTRIDGLTLGLAAATILAAAVQLVHLYRRRLEAEAAARDAALRSVRALAAAVDAKDHSTRDHSDRVAFVVAALAFDAGLEREHVERLMLAAHLHDVGKIAIPDAILLKPGRLTDEEYEVVRGHSTAGARMLEAAGLRDIAQWVKHHHERWDGTGYPSGLAGEQIPLESRLLGAADSLDAMTGSRSYRSSLTVGQAADEFERCAGSQFDPALARRLAYMLREGELGLGEELLSFSPPGREREAGQLLADLFGATSPLTEQIPAAPVAA